MAIELSPKQGKEKMGFVVEENDKMRNGTDHNMQVTQGGTVRLQLDLSKDRKHTTTIPYQIPIIFITSIILERFLHDLCQKCSNIDDAIKITITRRILCT